MRNNIVTVEYNGGCYIRTPELMQYDYGQILHLSGFGLPSAFQVDFGTSQIAGETVQVIGALDHVAIPDTLLQGAANIYAFIRLHTGADDGETVCVIELPVMARPEITGEEPTPVEQDLIDQLMAALIAGVAAAEAAAAQIERMSAEASTLPAGSPATATWDAEHGRLLLGIPKGDTGAAGAEGPEGPEGPAGSDGYSPTVTVEEIPGGHRVTITDAEGDHVFDVMDGQGGGGGTSDYEDLYNKPAINGTELNGALSAADLGLATPEDIPSVPVQSVNGKTGAVVLNASDVGAGTYSKPAGGIPKADMASDVQSSLDKADAALPKAGGTMTGAIAMGGSRITGLGAGVNDGDAATKKQLDDAIAGLGTVFTIKGDVAAVADLPASGNTVGDVYYVRAVSAAFVWLETTEHPTGYWEEFGEPIDLSGYIQKPSGATVNQYLVFNGTTWVASNLPAIPSTAADVGAIAAPSSPATGAFLVWNGSAWVAQTLSTWQGGSY